MTNARTDSFPTLELHYWEQCGFADIFNTDVLGTYSFDYSPLLQHKIFLKDVKSHMNETYDLESESEFGAKYFDTLTREHSP